MENYCDTTDPVDEAWFFLQRSILPKTFEYKEDGDKINAYVLKFPQKMYRAVSSQIHAWKTKFKNSKVAPTEPEVYYAGLVVRAARFFRDEQSDRYLPRRLPKQFPESLRNIGLENSRILLKQLHKNRLGWIDLASRKRGLSKQIALFSV